MITVQLPLDEETLSLLLNSPNKPEEGLITYIQDILYQHISQESEVEFPDQDQLLKKALKMAEDLEKGTQFIFHSLFEEHWSKVKQPRVFGRTFRKKVEEMGIAKHHSKTSDNKAIYIRK